MHLDHSPCFRFWREERNREREKKNDGNKTGDRLSESCNPPARSGVTDDDRLGQRAS